jgi:RNA polymerase subunit RPABC4/transcription elongation factor Spt4
VIDKQPLELFGDSGDDEPADANAPAPDAAQAEGYWSCQWCSARVPFGAAECPVCGGSLARRDRAPDDPQADLLKFFTEQSNPAATLARFYVEGHFAMGAGADRRETYQEYFDEALRRQARDAALPPVEEDPRSLACRWCNTPHEPDQVFCANCGTRLPPQAVKEAPAASTRCQWCQAEIEPGTTVCPACNGTIGDPEAVVKGLTDLTDVEKAAEYAFQQPPPIRGISVGIGGEIHRVNRLRKSLFGKRG